MNKSQLRLLDIIELNGVRQMETELLVWIDHCHLEEFTEIVGDWFFSEGGIECQLQVDCVCLDITDVIEYMDIDIGCISDIDNLDSVT